LQSAISQLFKWNVINFVELEQAITNKFVSIFNTNNNISYTRLYTVCILLVLMCGSEAWKTTKTC